MKYSYKDLEVDDVIHFNLTLAVGDKKYIAKIISKKPEFGSETIIVELDQRLETHTLEMKNITINEVRRTPLSEAYIKLNKELHYMFEPRAYTTYE